MADSTRKTAIITGANKGLGCAIAIHLSTQGYDIVSVFARDGAAAAESASAIRANGARCELIQTDIRDPAQVSEMVAKTKIEFGGVDALVNCAGLRAAGPLIDLKCEDWDSVVAVNLKAPFLLSQAVARVMLRRPPTRSCFGPLFRRKSRIEGAHRANGRRMGTVRHPRECSQSRRHRGAR